MANRVSRLCGRLWRSPADIDDAFTLRLTAVMLVTVK